MSEGIDRVPTPEQFDRQARAARARASRLHELAATIRQTAAPLDTALDEVARRHCDQVWLSPAAARSRSTLRVDQWRVGETKRLCDVMASRLRSQAHDQEYIARRSAAEAEAARRRAERDSEGE